MEDDSCVVDARPEVSGNIDDGRGERLGNMMMGLVCEFLEDGSGLSVAPSFAFSILDLLLFVIFPASLLCLALSTCDPLPFFVCAFGLP